MWNKKIIVTKHAIQRFEQRNIKYSTKSFNPIHQILTDLRPLNVRKREKLEDGLYKVTTNQGKVYIIREIEVAAIVLTVYKTNLMFQNEYWRFQQREERNKRRHKKVRTI